MKSVFLLPAAALASILVSCGAAPHSGSSAPSDQLGPVSLESVSEGDARALELAAKLQDNDSGQTGSIRVTTGKTYHAASGRQCRSVEIETKERGTSSQRRLTCLDSDSHWRFVPVVNLSGSLNGAD